MRSRLRIKRRWPMTARRCGGGRKFGTRPEELERLWADVGAEGPAEPTVVLEPTRNGRIMIAEWFRRRGAKVVMLSTTSIAPLPRPTGRRRHW